jgi:hypothetical protein
MYSESSVLICSSNYITWSLSCSTLNVLVKDCTEDKAARRRAARKENRDMMREYVLL